MVMFASHNYKHFHNENKDKHPILNWCLMINNDYDYCKNWNIFKWINFFYYKKIRSFKVSALPSWHPYWKYLIRIEKIIKRFNKVRQLGFKEIKFKIYYRLIRPIQIQYFLSYCDKWDYNQKKFIKQTNTPSTFKFIKLLINRVYSNK